MSINSGLPPRVSIHGNRFGLTPYGLEVDGVQFGSSAAPSGTAWYVDAKVGQASAGGRSWGSAMSTMEEAFTKVRSGDVIYMRGKVKEQLSTPVGVFDVSIIGGGNRPRHADNHTESDGKRGSSGATWTAPDAGSTANPLLIVNQQGWRIGGITWQIAGAATVCVRLTKVDDADDAERDGAHAELFYNKFQGNPTTPVGIGVQSNGSGFWKLEDNLFLGLVTAVGKVGSQGGQVGWGEIVNNRFSDNTNGIVSPLYRFVVRNNYFLLAHTKEIDLAGGAGNIVTENVFIGNYDAAVAGTGDVWFNNYSLDTTSGEVDDTTGQTTSIPVA